MVKNVLILIVGLLIFTYPASAMEQRMKTFYMQVNLEKLGFYKGELDGLSGPKMRAAMKSYANTEGISADEEDIWLDMIDRSRNARVYREFDPDLLANVKDAVKELLKDPYSAKFDDKFYRLDGVICGRVNAKNSYGAYTGYRHFYVSEVAGSIYNSALENSQYDLTWFYCNGRLPASP